MIKVWMGGANREVGIFNFWKKNGDSFYSYKSAADFLPWACSQIQSFRWYNYERHFGFEQICAYMKQNREIRLRRNLTSIGRMCSGFLCLGRCVNIRTRSKSLKICLFEPHEVRIRNGGLVKTLHKIWGWLGNGANMLLHIRFCHGKRIRDSI